MSENTIPQNNLPIYLQEYTVSVLGNLTSLDCTVAPEDEVGTIQYSTLGVIPSNKKDARVWDLKASGTLKPHDKDYIFHYDLSKVDYDGKVTFENPLSGVITVCGRVISISKKNATWFPCEETKTVSIIIDQSRWGFSITKDTPFSMDIQLDDDDSTIKSLDITTASSEDSIYTVTLDGEQATLTIKSGNTYSKYQITGNDSHGLIVSINGSASVKPTIELKNYYTNSYSSTIGYLNYYRTYEIPNQFSYNKVNNNSFKFYTTTLYTDFYIQGLTGEELGPTYSAECNDSSTIKAIALNASGQILNKEYNETLNKCLIGS